MCMLCLSKSTAVQTLLRVTEFICSTLSQNREETNILPEYEVIDLNYTHKVHSMQQTISSFHVAVGISMIFK